MLFCKGVDTPLQIARLVTLLRHHFLGRLGDEVFVTQFLLDPLQVLSRFLQLFIQACLFCCNVDEPCLHKC